MAKQDTTQIGIITVIGADRVGIIAALANAMAKNNINILDVNQRIMETFFVMTMAVDLTEATVGMDKIKKQLDRVAQTLSLNITIQNERIFEAIHRV
ncbi:MAG: ACT domain-containing protein [Phycisphaerae bacterium]|nr:ACT domain-containing protein [Phycisphaerae bacterium]